MADMDLAWLTTVVREAIGDRSIMRCDKDPTYYVVRTMGDNAELCSVPVSAIRCGDRNWVERVLTRACEREHEPMMPEGPPRIPNAASNPTSARVFTIDGTWAGDHTQAAPEGRSVGALPTWEGRWLEWWDSETGLWSWRCLAHPMNRWGHGGGVACASCVSEATDAMVAGLSSLSCTDWQIKALRLHMWWIDTWKKEGWAKPLGIRWFPGGVQLRARLNETDLICAFNEVEVTHMTWDQLTESATAEIAHWRDVFIEAPIVGALPPAKVWEGKTIDMTPPPMWTERDREIERNHAEAFKAAAQTNRAANALAEKWGADGLTGTAPGTVTPEVTVGDFNFRGMKIGDASGLTFSHGGRLVARTFADGLDTAIGAPYDLNNPPAELADAIRAYARANYPHPCGEYEGQRKTCKQLLVADQAQKDLELVFRLGKGFARTEKDSLNALKTVLDNPHECLDCKLRDEELDD